MTACCHAAHAAPLPCPAGIVALGFSPDGIHLTAVASDNAHTVYVYDWRRQRLVESGRGQNGDPPQVYGVEWNPWFGRNPAVPNQFITYGKKHVKAGAGAAAGHDEAGVDV